MSNLKTNKQTVNSSSVNMKDLKLDQINKLTVQLMQGILNNGGITLTPDGNVVTKGYVVSPFKQVETKLGDNPLSIELQHYLLRSDVQGLLLGTNNCLGAWVDSQTGHIYLDIVRVYFSLETALGVAKASNQIAIFDLEQGHEIRLDGGLTV